MKNVSDPPRMRRRPGSSPGSQKFVTKKRKSHGPTSTTGGSGPLDVLREKRDDPSGTASRKGKKLKSVEVDDEYRARFHAHPRDLDRLANANKTVAASKSSDHIFNDQRSWAGMGLHSRLSMALESMSLSVPTRIQQQTLASFRQASDESFILQAETGSGKTLAYLLPILQNLATIDDEPKKIDRLEAGTKCLIICPTRELAVQTLKVVEDLCKKAFNWIVPGSLFGEEKRKSEKARIRKGLNIIVATPGRLLDHLLRTDALLLALKGKIEWIVLDEADRLLDMGQGDQVKQIIERVRANQPGSGSKGVTWRSFLVSATINDDIKTLAKNCLLGVKDSWKMLSIDHSTATVGLGHSTPKQLNHFHVLVTAKLRLIALISFLSERAFKKERVVVFLSTCAAVDFIYSLFKSSTYIFDEKADGMLGETCEIFKLHGNTPRNERQLQLKNFTTLPSSRVGAVMFATDVAARGLNLTNCDWAVQYDPPSEISDYVHRAGRVARAGKAGNSLLFVLPSEKEFVSVLERNGLDELKALSLTTILQSAANKFRACSKDGGTKKNQPIELFSSVLQAQIERTVCSTKQQGSVETLNTLSQKAYLAHLRAYPTKEKAIRSIFTTKSLHLGHIARSYGLKEPPSKITSKSQSNTSDENTIRKSSMTFGLEDGEMLDKGDIVARPPPKSAKATMMRNASSIDGF